MSAVSGSLPGRSGRLAALTKPAEWQLALPLVLAFIAFFVAPLFMLIGVSAFDDDRITQLGFAMWTKFLGDAFYWKVTFDTLKLGLLTVGASVLIGYPLAIVYMSSSPRIQRVLLFIIIMPLLLSVVVRTFAWIVILGHEGVINYTLMSLGLTPAPLRLLQTEFGLVLSLTQIEMPLMLLPLISVMSRIDPNLRDASSALGASRWRTLFTVIFPLSLPGLIAGCQFDHSLYFAADHRRQPPGLSAAAHLAAVAGGLQLATGGGGGPDAAGIGHRSGGGDLCPGSTRDEVPQCRLNVIRLQTGRTGW